jgi:hypothetical protein
METGPSFSLLPAEKKWVDVDTVTLGELTTRAFVYCSQQLDPNTVAQMSEGQQRAFLLDSFFGKGGWNMRQAPQVQYPEYPQSVGMYDVQQPQSWVIQQLANPEAL